MDDKQYQSELAIRRRSMDWYDELPRELRDQLKEVNVEPGVPERLKARLKLGMTWRQAWAFYANQWKAFLERHERRIDEGRPWV